MRHEGSYISITALLCFPLSRGSMHVQSPDPHYPPRIDHGVLRHPFDRELLARHAIWMEKIAQTEPLASMLKNGGRRLHCPQPVTELKQMEKLMEELTISMYHTCGSCVMAPREDGGVVNPRLKVYGTQKLRVVDASMMPIIPRGNIQTTVYSVAEKAAAMIKEDNQAG